MHLSDTSSIAQHLKKHSCPTTQLRKILTDNTTILEHQNNKQKLQILEALCLLCSMKFAYIYIYIYTHKNIRQLTFVSRSSNSFTKIFTNGKLFAYKSHTHTHAHRENNNKQDLALDNPQGLIYH